MKISSDVADLVFRGLFCLIFIGLGGEHIFADALIQKLMPEWVPMKRLVSIACGLWLVFWGGLILVGWHIRAAAYALAIFLAIVTLAVHVPGLFLQPILLPDHWMWMWDVLQRSNLVKNLCLIGVCFHLLHHKLGKYSLDAHLKRQKQTPR